MLHWHVNVHVGQRRVDTRAPRPHGRLHMPDPASYLQMPMPRRENVTKTNCLLPLMKQQAVAAPELSNCPAQLVQATVGVTKRLRSTLAGFPGLTNRNVSLNSTDWHRVFLRFANLRVTQPWQFLTVLHSRSVWLPATVETKNKVVAQRLAFARRFVPVFAGLGPGALAFSDGKSVFTCRHYTTASGLDLRLRFPAARLEGNCRSLSIFQRVVLFSSMPASVLDPLQERLLQQAAIFFPRTFLQPVTAVRVHGG